MPTWNVQSVNLDITTVCNRACPECCANVHRRAKVFRDWPYFEQAAHWLKGIPRLVVTGGEPTTHPEFRRIAREFKGLFKCRSLVLDSNGFKVREYADVLRNFDEIFLTDYSDTDNGLLVRWLRGQGYAVTSRGDGHIWRGRRGSGEPCARGSSDTAAYSGGRFFPCCVAFGIEGAASLEPCEDWRDKIGDVPLPCKDCWFSP